MWLAFYNEVAVGDVLLLTRGPLAKERVVIETIDNVTLIRNNDNNEIVSVNVFGMANALGLAGKGNIELTSQQVDTVNRRLSELNIDLVIEVNNTPKFVVGYVESCVDHPDSDHLQITQTNVGKETLQIVCGASNVKAGQKVLVAKPGAVMPNGAIIWNGELRGEKSQGMICSTRELNLTYIEDKPGIWELPENMVVGTALADVVASFSNK